MPSSCVWQRRQHLGSWPALHARPPPGAPGDSCSWGATYHLGEGSYHLVGWGLRATSIPGHRPLSLKAEAVSPAPRQAIGPGPQQWQQQASAHTRPGKQGVSEGGSRIGTMTRVGLQLARATPADTGRCASGGEWQHQGSWPALLARPAAPEGSCSWGATAGDGSCHLAEADLGVGAPLAFSMGTSNGSGTSKKVRAWLQAASSRPPAVEGATQWRRAIPHATCCRPAPY